MEYRAQVFSAKTGELAFAGRVNGRTMDAAETRAVAKAAFNVKGNPADMVVRYLNQTGPRERMMETLSGGLACV